jgi:hypothetical protein
MGSGAYKPLGRESVIKSPSKKKKKKRKEKTTQTKSAWVKEVRVPQNL